MTADKGLTTQLSQRIGPQYGLAVSDAGEASIGGGNTGNPADHAVLVEDVSNVTVQVWDQGAGLTVCKVQGNNFTPDDDDSRWFDVAGGNLGAIGPLGTALVTIQNTGIRWFRLRSQADAGGTTIDLSWTGS